MSTQSVEKPKSKGRKTRRNQERFVDQQVYFRDKYSHRDLFEEYCAMLEDPNLPAESRTFYQNHKDYYEAHPDFLDRPVEFEAQVEKDVENIISRGLNKGIKDFGITLDRVANFHGLSIAWLSDKVSYSTAHFNRICNGRTVDVPKDLLTELCFLCRTDPYRLLGLDQSASVSKEELPLIKPLARFDPEVDNLPHYILDKLCVPGDQEKFARLRLIIKIARLKSKKYEMLIQILNNIPLVSNKLKEEPPIVSDMQPFMWMSNNLHFSVEESRLIDEAFSRLSFHRRNDMERLLLLVKLASAGDDVWLILKAILITGGFPASRNSYLD